jgi:hypothetical protein
MPLPRRPLPFPDMYPYRDIATVPLQAIRDGVPIRLGSGAAVPCTPLDSTVSSPYVGGFVPPTRAANLRTQPHPLLFRRGGAAHTAGLDDVESLRRRICTDPDSCSCSAVLQAATHTVNLRTNPIPFCALCVFCGFRLGLGSG